MTTRREREAAEAASEAERRQAPQRLAEARLLVPQAMSLLARLLAAARVPLDTEVRSPGPTFTRTRTIDRDTPDDPAVISRRETASSVRGRRRRKWVRTQLGKSGGPDPYVLYPRTEVQTVAGPLISHGDGWSLFWTYSWDYTGGRADETPRCDWRIVLLPDGRAAALGIGPLTAAQLGYGRTADDSFPVGTWADFAQGIILFLAAHPEITWPPDGPDLTRVTDTGTGWQAPTLERRGIHG